MKKSSASIGWGDLRWFYRMPLLFIWLVVMAVLFTAGCLLYLISITKDDLEDVHNNMLIGAGKIVQL